MLLERRGLSLGRMRGDLSFGETKKEAGGRGVLDGGGDLVLRDKEKTKGKKLDEEDSERESQAELGQWELELRAVKKETLQLGSLWLRDEWEVASA